MIRKDLRDKRAALLTEARGISDKIRMENREASPEETRRFDGLMSEADRMAGDIKRTEALQTAEAEREAPRGGARNGAGPEGEFRDFGEFIAAVRDHSGDLEYREMSASNGAAVLVPEQFRDTVMQMKPEDAIVRPRATVIPAGDPPDARINIPALDHSGDNGVYGAVAMQWIGEGAAKPETTPALVEVGLEPKELAGHTVLTDKLLRNSAAAGPLVARIFRQAIAGTEDYAFLCGDGVGKPLGVLHSDARIEVNRGTASHVKFGDVAAMLGRMIPESLNRAVWVANISVLPDLVLMSSDSNSETTVFIAGDASKGIPATLFGIPIRFTGKTPALGNAGDLMLCDFSHYLVKDGSGPFVAASPHVYFINNKTVIKAFWNVDGTPWLSAPMKLQDGVTTVSPFVVLK